MKRLRTQSGMAAVLVLVIAMAVAAPAGQAAKKRGKHAPRVDFAVAVFEEAEGTVGFAVKVRNATRVSVEFEGARQDAAPTPATPWWWDARFPAGSRQCYPIVVRASNTRRKVTKSIGAGMLGTPGCGGFGRRGVRAPAGALEGL
jgi:hypothetical protein